MKFAAEGFSIGLPTRDNQDAWAIRCSDTDQLVAAVADGVGGHKGGVSAANTAIQKSVRESPSDGFGNFQNLFREITKNIAEQASSSDEEKDMATTLSLVVLMAGTAQFAHVGDSRIYHLRGHGLVQVSEDQTEVALLLKQGILSPARARAYARRSVLLSALSARGDHELMTGEIAITSGDRLILLTDGAYRVISKKRLRDLSVAAADVRSLASQIHAELAASELRDDATVVAIEVLE